MPEHLPSPNVPTPAFDDLMAGNDSDAQQRDGNRPLRIGLVAPPVVRVPPVKYAGTERIVGVLESLVKRFGVHPLPVRNDVEAERLHLLDFVLAG